MSCAIRFIGNAVSRVKDDCIKIVGRVQFDNATYDRNAQGAGDNTKPKKLVDPLTHDPAIYVDEYVDGWAWFSKAETGECSSIL
jgi:hypothetical protein